ncbi:unnamed protein product [Lactuca saligna]|uniref:Protein BCCIP homolog n=1 Tax=Lactuca saligna TaxID=75948 RepID=A0AA35VDT0_LACSI|nr:unnamed protein product [Lactuca saligna]
MPRKPTRRTHLQKPQHAISRLGRSMALIFSARKAKQQNDIKAPFNSTGRKKEKHDIIESKREVSSSSSSENEDSSSEDEDDFEGAVQVDFVFYDPKPDDFHGVKVLMQTYLDNKEWDLTSFVDLILQQTSVGSVVKIEDDEDESVYGFVSALNLQRYKDCKCMMEVKEFLLSKCQEKEIKENLKSFLGEKAADVGLLISQRVVNLPPQLLPSLYDAIFNEISWATEDEPTKELRKFFCFKYYLLISKIYKLKNADKKKKGNSSNEEAIIYLKPEDEIFHNLSAWSFCFPLRTQQVTTNELKEYRLMGLVMAVKATSIPTFRRQLRSLIDE